jgi:hypothetical protein
MSSNGKSELTDAHARAEAQVSQDEEPAKGKQRRKEKQRLTGGREKGAGVFQGNGEVEEGIEDQDQQARAHQNEQRLPYGSPLGKGASDPASFSLKHRQNSNRRKQPITPDVEQVQIVGSVCVVQARGCSVGSNKTHTRCCAYVH